MSISLIDDVVGFGAKHLPKILMSADDVAGVAASGADDLVRLVGNADEVNSLVNNNALRDINIGRKLQRASRLAEVDAQEAVKAFEALKPAFKQDVLVDTLPATFTQDVISDVLQSAMKAKDIAIQHGYNPRLMKVGEMIGKTQNAVGKVGGGFGKVMSSPAGIPLAFAPDIFYMTQVMGSTPPAMPETPYQ